MKKTTPLSWRQRGRRFAWALLAISAVSANSIAAARTNSFPEPDQPSTLQFTATQAAARVHLDRFFQAVLVDDGLARMNAAVRVALPAPDGRQILVWITPFIAENGGYLGVPDGETAGNGAAELVSFNRSQIVDWSFVGDDGRIYGNFATRLMLHTVLPAQAGEIASILSESPAPEEWLQ
ncbi:hypothetical protein N9L47_08085 [Rhodobacteraceae bacterium]|nr:hypothetical protein [Paracoccaceae bacterium]